MVKTELIKFRCSKTEKLMLIMLTQRLSQKSGGQKVAYSEVMRVALMDMAASEFGIDKVNRMLKEE